jgi:hypothetical protein
MNKIISFSLILLFSLKALSQDSKHEFGLYNIGLGGIVGGIGALINKPKDEKSLKSFANGFWKGSIGGGMIHLSKITTGEIAIQEDYLYSWLAKASNSLGTSFVENATLNRPLLSEFHIHIFGFNRIEFSTETKFKVQYKLMPVAFLLNTYVVATSKFEFEKTIASGELIFSSNKTVYTDYKGYTLGTTLVMHPNFIHNKATFSHEVIHIYQYYDYNFVNSFLSQSIYNSKFLSQFDFLYYDLQGAILNPLYLIEKNRTDKYFDNFFEKEAGFYSNTIGDF